MRKNKKSSLINKKNDRIVWVDYFRGICILCVLGIHFGLPLSIYRFFSSFFLTGFFFVSGYLKKSHHETIDQLFNRICSLLIPFLAFGLIEMSINAIMQKEPIFSLLIGFISQISGTGRDLLWFISCLIVCEILSWIIKKVYNIKIQMAIYFCLLLLGFWFSYLNVKMIWHIEVAFIMIFFIQLGGDYRKFESKICNYEWKIGIVSLILYGSLILLFPNMYVDVHLGIYTNPVVFMISACVSIPLMIVICKKISFLYPLQYIGKNTLIYYAVHGKCQIIIKKIIKQLSLSRYITWILVYVVVVIVIGCFAEIINKWVPELAGRKRRK